MTKTYNCHSYAWNMTEGGLTCWLEQGAGLHRYWLDLSYVETTEAENFFYYNGDHSAVVSITHPGKYESKWGPSLLMRHTPGYVPTHYDTLYRKYYKKDCGVTDVINRTIGQYRTISNCYINVQNTTVQDNAKLILYAKNTTTINGPFEVTLGSELEIRVAGTGGVITIENPGGNGCGNETSDSEGTWMLHKMEGEFIWDENVWSDYFENDIPVNEWFTLTIDGNQLSGKSGCSGFQGNLAEENSSLVFTRVLSNLVGCLPQIQNLEHLYVDFVRRATSMIVSGDFMYLFIDNDPVLEFYRQVE